MSGGLLSLFFGSLLASTILPGGVEALLYWMVTKGEYTFSSLLIVSTVGNTLGGVITFFMGRLLLHGVSTFNASRKDEGVKANVSWKTKFIGFFQLEKRALERVRKWGVPVLFFSWAPIVGDPLCVAAGYLKLPMWPSFFFIALGKFCRYLVLLWLII